MDVLAAGLESTQSIDSYSAHLGEHRIFVPLVEVSSSKPRVILTGNRAAHVSVGILLRFGSKVLTVKKNTAPNVGRWSIPAGHCVWGESAFLAARRELMEETGIRSDQLELVYSGEIDEGVPCRYGQVVHFWFLYQLLVETVPDITLETAELAEFKWTEISSLKSIRRKTPAFSILVETAIAGLEAVEGNA
jgi:8-oxo-dGTP pyrophosphatase MutT (NUDIX family)